MNPTSVYPPFKKVDRNGWPNGEWNKEPDRVEWRMMDRYCFVSRTKQGSWCGYVGLPKGHRYHGIRALELTTILNTQVHRGITWSERGGVKFTWQFPVSDLWVVGFDCGYGGLDYQPGLPQPNEYYDDISYKNLYFAIVNVHILLAELEGYEGLLLLSKYTPTLIDDKVLQLSPYKVGVTGDGALLLKDWIRGNGNIGIGLDWIEEHSEYLDPRISREMFAELITQLRECYTK